MEIMPLESHTVAFAVTFGEGGALVAGSLPGLLNYFLPPGSYICKGWSWLAWFCMASAALGHSCVFWSKLLGPSEPQAPGL